MEMLGVAGATSMCVLTVNGEAYRGVLQIHRYKDGRDVYIQVDGSLDALRQKLLIIIKNCPL